MEYCTVQYRQLHEASMRLVCELRDHREGSMAAQKHVETSSIVVPGRFRDASAAACPYLSNE